MVVSIVANTSANYAQAALRQRGDLMTTGTQRLSTGLRVFSASEDAAALAVGTGLKVENAGLKTAMLNATSGISMLQIADGAMAQMGDVLIRMKTLAAQASSGHLEDSVRGLIDAEFQQLKSEIGRLANITNFNGVSMLAGTKSFTVDSGSTLASDGVSNFQFDQTIVNASQTFRYTYDATTEAITMTRTDWTSSVSQTIDLTALLDAVAGEDQDLGGSEVLDIGFSTLGVTMRLGAGFLRGTDIEAANTLTSGDVTVGGTPALALPTTNMAPTTVAGLNALVAGYSTTTGNLTLPLETNGLSANFGALAGISYKVDGGAQGASGAASVNLIGAGAHTVEVYVDVAGGGTELVGTWTAGAISTSGSTDGNLVLGVGKGLVSATYVDDNADTRLTYKVGTGVVASEDLVQVDIPAMTIGALGLTSLSVISEGAANGAITTLEAALTTLNQGRATVGAQQLRLEQVNANLGVVTENNERARSALLDVDVAKEISDLTQNQVLMQASVAMLTRANQIPTMLLELLKN